MKIEHQDGFSFSYNSNNNNKDNKTIEDRLKENDSIIINKNKRIFELETIIKRIMDEKEELQFEIDILKKNMLN